MSSAYTHQYKYMYVRIVIFFVIAYSEINLSIIEDMTHVRLYQVVKLLLNRKIKFSKKNTSSSQQHNQN